MTYAAIRETSCSSLLNDTHMVGVQSSSNLFKTSKMNSNILDNFNNLKNTNDPIRINAAVTLLNHLYHHNTNQDENEEINYALTRLVRSLGSSTMSAKRGSYSTLTVFLTMCPETSLKKLLSIMDTQLHPAGSNSKSENADICMGRILLCGTLIRSKLLMQNIVEIQQQVVEILLSAGKQRSYLSFISVVFLCEFIMQLDIQPMKKVVWPIIEKELCKPWSEQTLDSFYILLVVRDRYPSLVNHKFLKQHLNVEDIIDKESIEDIVRILTDVPRCMSYHHPVFEIFCKKLTSTNLTIDFWKNIDQKFMKPSKSDEYIAIEVLRLILLNIADKTIIPSLLSPNFLHHILKRFSNCKKNNDNVLTASSKILNTVVSVTSDKDMETMTQLSILKKLILDPGDLMIEKKTGIKVIQIITGNLRLDGIKKLCELYRNIIENKMATERENTKARIWTNAERSYAAQLLTRLMGHSETFSDQDWRLAQLIFLFNYGLCEVTNVGIELAPQFKDSFYRALDYKLPKLNDVRRLLSTLVHDLNSKLQSRAVQLRTPLSDAAFDAWKRVINLIGKLEKTTKTTEALPIFHTMNLHMGLQLFSDSEMAIMSINELQCCYERLIKKSKGHTKIDASMEEEPHWVEVVVDLLLSLLSRNNHLLRSLVGCVFPHICPYLTSSAVQQILIVLDVKNNQDILTTKESDEVSSGTENESDDDDTEENASNDEMSLEESESESDDMNIDGDETVTDRLRIAVRQALGDAASQTDNEDIDVDQINDDEAKRLDESLATAFKILRENRQSRSKKQTKTNQTMMHFRVRVIDLLDIYLETCPSMAITLSIIAPLFALLEFCVKDPYQKPLEYRVRACLKKLSALKKFKDTTDVDDNLFTTVLKILVEKGERSASVCQEISDKLADCCTFLVRCMQQANLSTENIVKIYIENLIAFFEKRDCILPCILFKGVLQLRWEDNWQLAPVLVRFAFDSNIRYFRRNQALELLLILYNNSRLLSVDTKYVDLRIKSETMLYDNTICIFKELHNLHANNKEQLTNGTAMQRKVQQKFIGLLLTLLRVIYAHHLPQVWNWQNIKTTLTKCVNRSTFSKDARSAYNKLATQIGIPLNVNSKQSSIGASSEKQIQSLERKMDDLEDEILHVNNTQKKKIKNKSKSRSKQILKKEARELRSEIISEGLEPFNFSDVHLPKNQIDAMENLQNGNSHESTTSRLSQKRTIKQTVEENSVSKRKKGANCA